MFAKCKSILAVLALAVVSVLLPMFQSIPAQAHTRQLTAPRLSITSVFGATDTADNRPKAFAPGDTILYRINAVNNGAPLPVAVTLQIVSPQYQSVDFMSQKIPGLPSGLTRFAEWKTLPGDLIPGNYRMVAHINPDTTDVVRAVGFGSFTVRSLLPLDLNPDKTKSESARLKKPGKISQSTIDVASCLLDAGSLFFPAGGVLRKLYGAYTVVNAVQSEGKVLITLAQTSDRPMAATKELVVTIVATFVPCADFIRHEGPVIVSALTKYLTSLHRNHR